MLIDWKSFLVSFIKIYGKCLFSCAPSFHYKLYHIQLFNQCAQKTKYHLKDFKSKYCTINHKPILENFPIPVIYITCISRYSIGTQFILGWIFHMKCSYIVYFLRSILMQLFLLNLVIPFSYVNTKFLDGVVLLYCQYFFLITKYSQYQFCSLRWLRFGNHHDDW